MLSRTQYNVNDYFNKKVCGFYVSFGHGFEYDRIYPDLLKEQNSNSSNFTKCKVCNNFALCKRYMAVPTMHGGRGECGVANFWKLRIEPSNRLYNESYS